VDGIEQRQVYTDKGTPIAELSTNADGDVEVTELCFVMVECAYCHRTGKLLLRPGGQPPAPGKLAFCRPAHAAAYVQERR